MEKLGETLFKISSKKNPHLIKLKDDDIFWASQEKSRVILLERIFDETWHKRSMEVAKEGRYRVLLYSIQKDVKIGDIKQSDLWFQNWLNPRKLTFMMSIQFRVESKLREVKMQLVEEVDDHGTINIFADWSQTSERLPDIKRFINKRDITSLGTYYQQVINLLHQQHKMNQPTMSTSSIQRPKITEVRSNEKTEKGD